MFSPQTVELFKSLVDDLRLPGNHPQFDQIASMVSTARKELDEYYKQQQKESKKAVEKDSLDK